MLEIELARALEPEMMGEQPCGICGADFQPEAVLAQLVTDSYLPPVCEPCLSHLARRALATWLAAPKTGTTKPSGIRSTAAG
jgi:hypothetical protein